MPILAGQTSWSVCGSLAQYTRVETVGVELACLFTILIVTDLGVISGQSRMIRRSCLPPTAGRFILPLHSMARPPK